MRYRMSVIYGHPVIATARALRFSDHVTQRNGDSGDENVVRATFLRFCVSLCNNLAQRVRSTIVSF